MATKSDQQHQVKTAFITNLDGVDVTYSVGDIVDADDPGLKRAPEHFGPVVARGKAPVEQATAAPGEKRG
jgi:hypothetical protein